jgi:membrane protein YdbS with pleckstrin-like domain
MTTKWDKQRQRVGQRNNLRFAKRRRWAAWVWFFLAVSTTTLLSGLAWIIVSFWLSGNPFMWETTAIAAVLFVILMWILVMDGKAWRDAMRFDEKGNEWHERR